MIITETYPVPSIWNPVAFVSRATLPPSFDLVFGKNARYPRKYAEIGTNPFRTRAAALKRAKHHLAKNFTSLETQDTSLVRDDLKRLLEQDCLKRILNGRDPMTPTLKNQKFWAAELSPQTLIASEEWIPEKVWTLLTQYNFELLKELGTPSQREGIFHLGLEGPQPPQVHELSARLKAQSGWKLVPANEELSPSDFFAFLAQKQFPVVSKVRPLHALFCGFEPDYWHEAIGHLTFLTDPEFSDFYQFCGKLAEELQKRSCSNKDLNNFYRVLWTLLEYGLIQTPSDGIKAFGAALTSSFMALQRLKRGLITHRPFDPVQIIRSGFADERTKNRPQAKFEFFCIGSLNEAKVTLTEWTLSMKPFSQVIHGCT